MCMHSPFTHAEEFLLIILKRVAGLRGGEGSHQRSSIPGHLGGAAEAT